MSSSTTTKAPKTSKVWLVALPLAVLTVGFGLWTFTRGPAPSTGKPQDQPAANPKAIAVDSSLASIAVQQGDLPEGFRSCPFSGDMETHLARMKEANPASHEGLLKVWKQLQGQGAIAAYAAYWGDSDESCKSVVEPASVAQGPGTKHVTTTFSVVVRHESPAAAASAYQADIFRQSALKTAPRYEVTEGPATGLATNAIVGVTPQATIPLHQAVWQNASISVLYGSENLPLTISKQVTDAVNRRIT